MGLRKSMYEKKYESLNEESKKLLEQLCIESDDLKEICKKLYNISFNAKKEYVESDKLLVGYYQEDIDSFKNEFENLFKSVYIKDKSTKNKLYDIVISLYPDVDIEEGRIVNTAFIPIESKDLFGKKGELFIGIGEVPEDLIEQMRIELIK